LKEYQPEIFGVLFAVALLNSWYLCGIAVEEKILPIHYDYIIKAITVSGSAAFGAFLAFRFNSHLEEKKNRKLFGIEQQKEIALLNRALFNLGRQINTIGNMKRTLGKYSNDTELAFTMKVIKNFNPDIKLNIDELTLVLTDELPMLIVLDNEQDGYNMAIEAFNVRSEHFLHKLQPEMFKLGLLGRKITKIEIEEKLPKPIFKASVDSAMQLKENVYLAEEGLFYIYAKFRAACRVKYPDAKFLNVEKQT
jgi:hypothetical protein